MGGCVREEPASTCSFDLVVKVLPLSFLCSILPTSLLFIYFITVFF